MAIELNVPFKTATTRYTLLKSPTFGPKKFSAEPIPQPPPLSLKISLLVNNKGDTKLYPEEKLYQTFQVDNVNMCLNCHRLCILNLPN